MMNINVVLSLVFSIALVTGCAGTQTHLRILESGGAIRTDISDDDSYDYKVFIKNTIDFGWDGGREADRIMAVNLMFKNTCRKIEIVDQIPIRKGEYLFGKEAVTWVMKVKCVK